MRHRADELAVLQNRAARHPLHNAARGLQQRRIRHGQQVARAAVFAVNAADLHRVIDRRVPRNGRTYDRRAGFDRVVRRRLHGRALRRLGHGAKNAEHAVARNVADGLPRIEAADQLAGRAGFAALRVGDVRAHDAARAQRHEHAAVLIRDAVTQRAVCPRRRVAVRHRADAGNAVTQPQPQLHRAVRRDGGRDSQLRLRAAAQHRHRELLVRLRQRRQKIVRRFDFPPVDGADHVARTKSRVPRRRHGSLRRFHVRQPRHEHALRRHLDADRLPHRDQFPRLRRDRQNQRRAQCANDRKTPKMLFSPQKIPPQIAVVSVCLFSGKLAAEHSLMFPFCAASS